MGFFRNGLGSNDLQLRKCCRLIWSLTHTLHAALPEQEQHPNLERNCEARKEYSWYLLYVTRHRKGIYWCFDLPGSFELYSIVILRSPSDQTQYCNNFKTDVFCKSLDPKSHIMINRYPNPLVFISRSLTIIYIVCIALYIVASLFTEFWQLQTSAWF